MKKKISVINDNCNVEIFLKGDEWITYQEKIKSKVGLSQMLISSYNKAIKSLFPIIFKELSTKFTLYEDYYKSNIITINKNEILFFISFKIFNSFKKGSYLDLNFEFEYEAFDQNEVKKEVEEFILQNLGLKQIQNYKDIIKSVLNNQINLDKINEIIENNFKEINIKNLLDFKNYVELVLKEKKWQDNVERFLNIFFKLIFTKINFNIPNKTITQKALKIKNNTPWVEDFKIDFLAINEIKKKMVLLEITKQEKFNASNVEIKENYKMFAMIENTSEKNIKSKISQEKMQAITITRKVINKLINIYKK